MPLGPSEPEILRLMDALYEHYGYDFRDYSGASRRRRVVYAMQQMNCQTIAVLQARVVDDPAVFAGLLAVLTIPVTEMFRDPDFFLALREQVVPVLRTYPSLKIWVAGCSTGEEVYSLAILLREEDLLERSLIYATDINPSVLDKARQGIFAAESVKRYTENYQKAGGRKAFSDYYTAAYDAVRIDPALRQNVTFADHSLATDSVFSQTHLICCRNVIIYFNKTLQDRTLGLFHESLGRRGFLGLGSRESLDFSAYSARFEPVDKARRLFRKA
ncbi:MAG: protein-glutamate O-methyltransferase CheR [Pseudomonadota bacterium]|nr:protein-glutamate O-methyltransferase CheR [Pseudomonadota bacterium]